MPDEKAKTLCINWMKELDSSTFGKKLLQKNCGLMLGILICTDGTIYKAFSGEMSGSYVIPGFVEPVFNLQDMEKLLKESDFIVKHTKNPVLCAKISAFYTAEIQNLYNFYCYNGENISLKTIYLNNISNRTILNSKTLSTKRNEEEELSSQNEKFFFQNSLKYTLQAKSNLQSSEKEQFWQEESISYRENNCNSFRISWEESANKNGLAKEIFSRIFSDIQKNNSENKIFSLLNNISSHKPLPLPTGTGDCAEIRLLNTCFKNHKHPGSMAVFFYGNGSREHKTFYTPCDERCKPLLSHIIGLDVIYLDNDIIVVNKPSGLLSIEGKTEKDCIASRVRTLYNTIEQPCVHRLDMATSGIIVLARTKEAHRNLSIQFENRNVYKEYTAIVKGLIKENCGIINLPIRPDINNRPYQIVDFEKGKNAITEWRRLNVIKKDNLHYTKLLLIPKTGRTHQLRVHCAYGLRHPILNDALYGKFYENSKQKNQIFNPNKEKNTTSVEQRFSKNCECDAQIIFNNFYIKTNQKALNEQNTLNNQCIANILNISNSLETSDKPDAQNIQNLQTIPNTETNTILRKEDMSFSLALKATKLCFTHPTSGKAMEFSIPCDFIMQ